MQYRRLGRSGLSVSEICLGTMTFGSQCDEVLSRRIMDLAWDRGIDFFDVAEMYPVPPNADTFGRSEEIVGRWLKDKPRHAVIIATKITGPGHGWFRPPVRDGKTALDRRQILVALEGSLTRLGTDYIDLYQTHWPDHGFGYHETLDALTRASEQGKIRVLGCSNETCWGLMKSLATADQQRLMRYETVQNNFSLINRRCESELAQVCRQEGVSLLPYSPLGGGVLSGKYQRQLPDGARFSTYLQHGGPRQKMMAERFLNQRTEQVVELLLPIAAELGVPLSALALAWSKQHDFVGSTIVGATSVEQLEESLLGAELTIDAAAWEQIEAMEQQIPCAMREDGLRRL